MIYWTDFFYKRIERMHYNGSLREVLIDTDLSFPLALTLDTGNGNMYWTDRFLNKIERANLDGSNRFTVVTASSFALSITGTLITLL